MAVVLGDCDLGGSAIAVDESDLFDGASASTLPWVLTSPPQLEPGDALSWDDPLRDDMTSGTASPSQMDDDRDLLLGDCTVATNDRPRGPPTTSEAVVEQVLSNEEQARETSLECWGAQLTGNLGNCTPGYQRGSKHQKNKFCSSCRRCLSFPVERVCALRPELHGEFVNSWGSGVWAQSQGKYGSMKFRVLNHTNTCHGPRVLLFQKQPAPGLIDVLGGPLPDTWVQTRGVVDMFVSKGTLIPLACVPPTKGGQAHAIRRPGAAQIPKPKRPQDPSSDSPAPKRVGREAITASVIQATEHATYVAPHLLPPSVATGIAMMAPAVGPTAALNSPPTVMAAPVKAVPMTTAPMAAVAASPISMGLRVVASGSSAPANADLAAGCVRAQPVACDHVALSHNAGVGGAYAAPEFELPTDGSFPSGVTLPDVAVSIGQPVKPLASGPLYPSSAQMLEVSPMAAGCMSLDAPLPVRCQPMNTSWSWSDAPTSWPDALTSAAVAPSAYLQAEAALSLQRTAMLSLQAALGMQASAALGLKPPASLNRLTAKLSEQNPFETRPFQFFQ